LSAQDGQSRDGRAVDHLFTNDWGILGKRLGFVKHGGKPVLMKKPTWRNSSTTGTAGWYSPAKRPATMGGVEKVGQDFTVADE
jgi:hypothetical protein